MKKEIKYTREGINIAASTYLCDQEEGDLYDAYVKLKKVLLEHNGDIFLADEFVNVWQPLGHLSVDEIIDLIETSYENTNEECTPEFISNMNWDLLQKQKLTLLDFTFDDEHKRFSIEEINDINGIINVIDAIQDYAIDKCGIDSDVVFTPDLDYN